MTQHWDRNILEQEVNQVKKMTMHPDFWTTNPKAQTLVRKLSMLEEKLNFIDGTLSEINNNEELVAMAEMENDEDMMTHIQQQLSNMIKILEQKEIESLMSDPQDSKDCFLEIHTGAGGEDASDWSQMLVNMYMTCIKNSQLSEFDVTLDDISYKETGIRSALLQIRGKYAYGYLKKEQGVHRLVRLSPFDAAHKRHTSFSSVRVYPMADTEDSSSIFQQIPASDLKFETIRAATAGGQHANKTESGVRLTHIPTGVTVQCIATRSQHQNKDQALNQLRSRLQDIERAKKVKEVKDIARLESEANQFGGNVIRSYVLHPYQMIKDARASEIPLHNAEEVLDGRAPESFDSLLKNILRNSNKEVDLENNLI